MSHSIQFSDFNLAIEVLVLLQNARYLGRLLENLYYSKIMVNTKYSVFITLFKKFKENQKSHNLIDDSNSWSFKLCNFH